MEKCFNNHRDKGLYPKHHISSPFKPTRMGGNKSTSTLPFVGITKLLPRKLPWICHPSNLRLNKTSIQRVELDINKIYKFYVVHVKKNIHTYIYIYIYVCVYMYIYICASVYTYIHIYIYIYIYVCVYIYMYIYRIFCVYTYVHIYIYI